MKITGNNLIKCDSKGLNCPYIPRSCNPVSTERLIFSIFFYGEDTVDRDRFDSSIYTTAIIDTGFNGSLLIDDFRRDELINNYHFPIQTNIPVKDINGRSQNYLFWPGFRVFISPDIYNLDMDYNNERNWITTTIIARNPGNSEPNLPSIIGSALLKVLPLDLFL
nr:hypothetical protein [Candidatus Sigynarchaeota archaeon]